MRVFLDTNVLVSALMGHGLCHDLLDRIILNHSVLLGAPGHAELHRILTTKFGVPDALWHELNDWLRTFEQVPGADLSLDVSISDTDDLEVIASAVAAGADLIVTGDQELLEIGRINHIPIMSPRQCWMNL